MSSLIRLSTRSIRSTTSSTPRLFSTTHPNLSTDGIGKDKTHTVNKTDQPNVQTQASKQGMDCEHIPSYNIRQQEENSNQSIIEYRNRKSGTGGTATSQQDSTNSVAKSKKEFPEQPANNAGIGFQDERGGKGL